MDFDIKPASDYPIPDLVEALNRGFEGYFVPIAFNITAFLNMLRKDGLDLTSSRVLLANRQPVGIALIARRGWTSRLAAMGIATETRGKGAGSWFMEHLIQEACDRGEREMVLEVIEQNTSAVHLYEKCGFEAIRRLIGLIRKDATEIQTNELKPIDIRHVGHLVTQYGLSNLPWQLSCESIVQMNPPARAYQKGQSYAVISNPDAKEIVIWSLLVEPDARGKGLGTDMLKTLLSNHVGKIWHIPALLPEELGKVYERAGFEREDLSQWQMRLHLNVSGR